MSNINLSYIVTTRNKIQYLKIVLHRLLENVGPDEEVVVVDSDSTDGTKEYLDELHKNGKIHQYISEPDRGEAHGWNKALLLARGEVIKLISDDDAYFYPGIQECKAYMLSHPEIDVVCSNLGGADFTSLPVVYYRDSYEKQYRLWMEQNIRPFTIQGLTLLIRRSQIPLLGLFHTGCQAVDREYGFRISYVSNVAFFTNPIVVRLGNLQSGCTTRDKVQFIDELERTALFYKYIIPPNVKAEIDEIKRSINMHGRFFQKIIDLQRSMYLSSARIYNAIRDVPQKNSNSDTKRSYNIDEAFQICENWLLEWNRSKQGQFFVKKNYVPKVKAYDEFQIS